MIPLVTRLASLVDEFGCTLEAASEASELLGLCSLEEAINVAAQGTLVPLLRPRAEGSLPQGVVFLAAEGIPTFGRSAVRHRFPGYVLARLLSRARVDLRPPELGVGVRVGERVVLERGVRIGDRVTLGHGAVIGARGFGFAEGPSGECIEVPHLGGVEIGADVSVGALTTIDAGVLSPTRIGCGTKIDAHCHVGHNVEIGEHSFIAAQAGIAGSTKIGSRVRIGGQVGIADHLVVGDGAQIAAKSGVIGNVPAGATFAGYPARPRLTWLRDIARTRRSDRSREMEAAEERPLGAGKAVRDV